MYKLLIPILFLVLSCRAAKNTRHEDAVTKAANETIQSLKDSGIIK